MFRKIDDFKTTWEREIEFTRKVFDALTDRSLSQPIADSHRTLGHIAWHIVTTIPEMTGRTGLKFTAVGEHDPMPKSAAELASAFQAAADQLLAQVTGEWTDETLATTDNMYGEQWPRGQTLQVLHVHQAHHRGQMTVLMRQAGLKVPGVYGPAKEEWKEYGMEEPPL